MLARRTIIGTIAGSPLLRNRHLGRAAMAVILAILLFFSVFPERYRAAVTLTPTDPTALGLSGTLGQLGALNSVFGNQAAVEIALKIGRGIYTREMVANRLKLMDRLGFANRTEMHRWLERNVEIRSLRGGIVQFETKNKDPDLARDLVGAFADATQEELARISRRQTDYKRGVLIKLVTEASNRLARARGAYDTFRLSSRYANPSESIEAIGSQIPLLQGAIRSKEVQLTAARQFATDENMNVRQILAELKALRAQLAQAEATNPAQKDSVGRAVLASTQAEKLQRELSIAQTLYDSYMRFLEGTSVEDMTSTASVRILERPFVDTKRQVNWAPLAAAIALFLLWMAIEFYRLRPPVGERMIVREV
jgi:capsule polysaccharide export protein KpsE/RkpR